MTGHLIRRGVRTTIVFMMSRYLFFTRIILRAREREREKGGREGGRERIETCFKQVTNWTDLISLMGLTTAREW